MGCRLKASLFLLEPVLCVRTICVCNMNMERPIFKKMNNPHGGGGYENKGTPNSDPQIVGSPDNKDPNKLPPIS